MRVELRDEALSGDEAAIRNGLHKTRDMDPRIVGGGAAPGAPAGPAEPVARFVASLDGVPVARPAAAAYSDGIIRAPVPVRYAVGYPRGDALIIVLKQCTLALSVYDNRIS